MLETVLGKLFGSGRHRARSLAKRASASLLAGDRGAAEHYCRKALELDADQDLAHNVLAKTLLHGPDYMEVLRQLHAHLQPRTYLEVGIRHGDSLALAAPATIAIGIDPAPELRHAFGPRTRIVRETSDDGFASRVVDDTLGGAPIELAFIDGMHKFEFALRDFINIEKRAAVTSTILVHDCYPLDEATARRDRVTKFWSGDVWRLILALRKYRPDLEVHTIATAPTGLGLIRRLDPTSTVLADQLDTIIAEFVAVPYEALASDKDRLLALFPNEWSKIAALFGSA